MERNQFFHLKKPLVMAVAIIGGVVIATGLGYRSFTRGWLNKRLIYSSTKTVALQAPTPRPDERYEIIFIRKMINALASSPAEVRRLVVSHPNMSLDFIDYVIRQSIKSEQQGNKTRAVEWLEGGKQIADYLYEIHHIRTGHDSITKFQRWSASDKQVFYSADSELSKALDLSLKEAYSEALTGFAKSLRQFETLEHFFGASLCHSMMGYVYTHTQQYKKAIESFNAAYKMASSIPAHTVAIQVLLQLIDYQGQAADYRGALLYARQAAELARSHENKHLLAEVLRSTGYVYRLMGSYEDAIEYYKQALEAERPQNTNRKAILQINTSLAEAQYLLKDYTTTQATIDYIIGYAEQPRDNHILAHAYYLKGNCYLAQGQYEQALEIFKNVLPTIRNDCYNLSLISPMARGQTHYALGQYREALHCYDQIAKSKTYHPYAYAQVRWEIGKVYEKQGKKKRALQSYEAAIQAVEKGRSRLHSPLLASNYFEMYGEPYDLIVALLSDQGRYADALRYKEKAKARTLLDTLNNNDVLSHISKELSDKKAALQAKISRLQNRLLEQVSKGEESGLRTVQVGLESQLSQAQREYLDVLALIQIQHPQDVSRPLSEPGFLPDLQKRVLEPETALIEYHVSDAYTLAWIITTDHFAFKKLPVGKADLQRRILILRKSIEKLKQRRITLEDLRYDLPTAHALYKDLVEPIAPEIKGRTRLVIIQDDVLSYLPFETLPISLSAYPPASPEGPFAEYRVPLYLIEKYKVAYAPSANALRRLKTNASHINADSPLLALGDPIMPGGGGEDIDPTGFNTFRSSIHHWSFNPLQYAGQEIKDIKGFFRNAQALVREKATEEAFRKMAGQYAILHFATHAVSNDRQPLYSFILLSRSDIGSTLDDGLLRAVELYDFPLKASLVTLSACETGLGRLSKGEGMIGLVNTLFQGGVKSVVASLWSVNDDATALLMKYFYENLSRGLDKDESLRQAKTKLIRECKNDSQKKYYANPLLWGSFVLLGDYR